jgi:hypothetical protein
MAAEGATAVAIAVACIALAACGSGQAGPPVSAETINGKEIPLDAEAVAEPSELADSEPLDRAYSISALEPAGTFRLSFAIPDGADGDRFVVASSENGEDWELYGGTDDGGSFVVETNHLSVWQLRQLNCPKRLVDGDVDFSVSFDSSLIYACPGSSGGRPTLRVYNRSAAGMRFELPRGASVAKATSPTLGELVGDLSNQVQLGEQWHLLPGDGMVEIELPTPNPARLSFEIAPEAAVFDAALGVLDAPSAAVVQCLYGAASAFGDKQVDGKGGLASMVKKVLLDCAGLSRDPLKTVARLLNTAALGNKAKDTVLHSFQTAVVRLSERQAARLPEPRPANPENIAAYELTPDSFGPIEVGMRLGEIKVATGVQFRLGPQIYECRRLLPPSPIPGLFMRTVHGVFSDLDISGGRSGISTSRGIKIGDPEAALDRAYGNKLRSVFRYGATEIFNVAGISGSALQFSVESGRVRFISFGDPDHFYYPSGFECA